MKKLCGAQSALSSLAAILLGFSINTTQASSGEATGFLELESVPDGRCQILSDGGKLTVLRSTHRSKRINYRLRRVFATKTQGLTTGILEPNRVIQKLGCDKVDGRAQTWEVDRARFVEE
ncbi:MAG: hypothetical protein EXR86_14190 [Gammaproteobacteria bacterium]|nr:hypothetical protein [Gammaproteobacteria bacterium]